MTVKTIIDEIGTHLTNLTATNPICSSFGAIFVDNKNLFYNTTPSIATPLISILPYGGEPPTDLYKYNSHVQIRIKTKTNSSGMRTGQAIINYFNRNYNISASLNGVVISNQSQPIPIKPEEGGEWKINVVNLTIKHVRL